MLLFLSRSLDSVVSNGNNSDDLDKGQKDNGSSSTRWDFVQGEQAMQTSKLASKSKSARLYRRRLQKRLMHHKQQLLDLQQAKKNFLTTQIEKHPSVMSKEAEVLMKQQEQLFKKQLKQYSSKVSLPTSPERSNAHTGHKQAVKLGRIFWREQIAKYLNVK